MALSLCIGLLIDDAIVVRENIVRHLGMGKDHKTAAREGTDEIGLAVMATTFAIVAVFVPIAFMSGIIGRFFFQFGVTVAVAVMVSLFVSFTLDPMLSAVWHDPPGSRFKRVPWLGRFMEHVEHFIEWMHRVYGSILEWALTHRKSVLAISLAAFVGSFALVPLIGTEFVPQADQGFISLRLNTPVGSSLEYTNSKVRQVEETLKKFPEITLAMTTVGTDEGRNYARINLKLKDRGERAADAEGPREGDSQGAAAHSRDRAHRRLQSADLRQHPGAGPGDAHRIGQRARRARVANVPGIADLELSEKPANPALSVRLNNDAAADLGITVQQVGATLRPLLAGDTVSYWLGPDAQNYEVNVRLAKDRRQLASDLSNLYLTTGKRGPDGELRMVPLRQVAEIVETYSPQTITARGAAAARGAFRQRAGPARRRRRHRRQQDHQGNDAAAGLPVLGARARRSRCRIRSQAAMAALGLAVIFIYLILASQFASYLQPVAIMVSLPFSLIGVFLALMFTGTTLNIFSMIGFIMLMGLVTKNAILLVDFANRARRGGASLHDAMLQAGQVRLRPILMTTAAMIGGMLPLALGVGEGGETQAPMGRAIIGGVITSTLLTLVVVPILYTYLDGWSERSREARGQGGGRARLPGGAAE